MSSRMLLVYKRALFLAAWVFLGGCGAILGIKVHDGLGNGTACGGPNDCASGFCIGVCCESACEGACEACDSEDHPGFCLPRPEGTPCGPDLTCDSAGECKARPLEVGEGCALDGECKSGVCTDNVCCERACGKLEVCTAAGLCRTSLGNTCSADAECASGFCVDDLCCSAPCAANEVCSPSGVCLLLQGEACGGDTECLSTFCTDNVCCASTCSECERCDGAKPGACEPIARDTDPKGECGASCDGMSGCREVVELATGLAHSCALLSDGAVKCWGDNTLGQLGDGGSGDAVATVAGLDGLSGKALHITAGQYHTCALLGGGAVKCWGQNEFGQLGNGLAVSAQTTPVDVVGLGTGQLVAAGITCGTMHTCAWLTSGAVRCWGDNQYGQLGTGLVDPSLTPVVVSGIDGVSAKAMSAAAGSGHTCAVLASGAIRCWGYNIEGQLGDGTFMTSLVPTSVAAPMGTTFVAVAAGGLHTCAMVTGGAVMCWGSNGSGQLGNGMSGPPSSVPVTTLLSGSPAVAIVTGSLYSCALLDTGPSPPTPSSTVACWGGNSFGQLGDSTTVSNAVPSPVLALDSIGYGAIGLAGHYAHACVPLSNGSGYCWGANVTGQLGDPGEIGPKL